MSNPASSIPWLPTLSRDEARSTSHRASWLITVCIFIFSSALAEQEAVKSVIELAKRARDSVVTLISEREVAILSGLPTDLQRNSAQYVAGDLRIQNKLQRTLASGIVFDDAGHVVTLGSALAPGSRYYIKLRGKRRREVQIIGSDFITNIAVYKGDTAGLVPVVLARNKLSVGQNVLAIANPFGLEGSVTSSQIAGLDRFIESNHHAYSGLIQLTTPLNPGEMGGLLVNQNGEAEGMLSFSYGGESLSRQPNISFAIPFTRVDRIARQLIENGKPIYGWLGITVKEPADGNGGALVHSVPDAASPVKDSILKDDLILRVDEQEITHPLWLQSLVLSSVPGTEVELTLLRGGQDGQQEIKQKVMLLKAPDNPPLVQILVEPVFIGASLTSMTEEIRRTLGFGRRGGVLITETVKDSPAYRTGLRPGDILIALAGKPLTSHQQCLRLLTSVSKGFHVDFYRDGLFHSVMVEVAPSMRASRATYEKVD